MKGILVLTLVNCVSGYALQENFVDVVLAVKEYFRSGCIFIVHNAESGMDEYGKLYATRKTLSVADVSVSIILTSVLLDNPELLYCNYNRPICIFTENGPSLQNFFPKLGDEIPVSSIIWLLFLDMQNSLENYFANINVPFDCEFLVAHQRGRETLITEVYRVRENHPLQTYPFGNWTPDDRLILPTMSFYQRRNNLQGISFKTGIIAGDFIEIKKEERNKTLEIGGSFGDIWNTLGKKLNFTSDYYKPEGDYYGSYLENGSWNGLIGMIMRKEIHVANVDMTWTPNRFTVVDFVAQIDEVRRYVFIKTPDSTDFIWDTFMTPFGPGLWLMLVLSLATLSAFLWITTVLWRRFGSQSFILEEDMGLWDTLFCSFGAFCYQGHEETPALMSSRIIFLITHVTAVIMMTSYSASLTSHIMTKVYKLPFKTFDEILKIGTYHLLVEPYSSQLTYFKDANNSMLRQVYYEHIAPIEASLPKSVVGRLESVCNHKTYGTIATLNDVSHNSYRLSCSLVEIPKALISAAVSFAIQKRSPYKGILKHTLHNMFRTGLIKIDREQMIKVGTDISSVTLTQVAPVLVLLGAGAVVALLLMAIERFLRMRMQRNKERVQEYMNENYIEEI